MTATLHFFTQSLGPQPVSFYESNFSGLAHKIRFSGYPHSILEKLFSSVCRRAGQEDTPIQVIHNCLDNSIQGVILPELSAGAFGFEAIDPSCRNIVGLGGNPDLNIAEEQLSAAHKMFLRARTFHDSQEKIYLRHLDIPGLDRLTEETIRSLLGRKSGARMGPEVHRFFGAASIEGPLDYIPQVTEEIPRRFFLKGRPGTGKSTFLKKVAAAARRRGCAVEIYHCSLDPRSLDLVAVRELDFCLLDSTAPHEYFPSREGDEIIDLYAACVEPGTDQAHAGELQLLQTSYRETVRAATGCLKEAWEALERFSASLPVPAEETLENVEEDLIRRLFHS